MLRGALTDRVGPLSVAFGHGSLWLAFQGAPTVSSGELVRLSARTLKVISRWPIAGSPEALVVTSRYVWVAGDISDGRPPAFDANRVQQFTLGGVLVHAYAVDGPTGMAGQGDSVWVEYGYRTRTRLRQLNGGIAGKPVPLTGHDTYGAGGRQPVVACQDGVYAATVDDRRQRGYVDRIVSGRRSGSATLAVEGPTSLICARAGGVLAITPDDTDSVLQSLPFYDRALPAALSLPDYSYALGGSDGTPWIGLPNGLGTSTRVWLVNPEPLRSDVPVTLPVGVTISTTAGRALWAVGEDNKRANRWIITELAPGAAGRQAGRAS